MSIDKMKVNLINVLNSDHPCARSKFISFIAGMDEAHKIITEKTAGGESLNSALLSLFATIEIFRQALDDYDE